MLDYLKAAAEQESYIISLRRELHRHPELSGKEERTVERICGELDKMGISYVNVPKGGVYAFLGNEKAGKTVLLRADIDALPVMESALNGGGRQKAVVSQVPGVAHMCGHDCHTAMLLGAAGALKDKQEQIPGRIILMFERGEEGGGNIVWLHKWAFENSLRVDASFALHVVAMLPKNKFHVYKDYASAGSVSFSIKLIGKSAHGSDPVGGNSPVDCFVSLYNTIQTLRMRFASPHNPVTFSVGRVNAGSAPNVIPAELEFAGSFRVFDWEDGIRIRQELEHAAKETANLYHCAAQTRVSGPTLGVLNDNDCAQYAAEKFRGVFGEDALVDRVPNMASESYGLTAKLWPGVFAELGIADEQAGITAGQHSECFDVAEEALKLGTAAHLCYAMEFLKGGPDTSGRVYRGDIKEFYQKYFAHVMGAFD